jgi:hypothetical protein
MDREEAKSLVGEALDLLFACDIGRDLPKGVHERTLTHRLAIYIELVLMRSSRVASDGRPWSVDCEYNRDGPDDPKELMVLATKLAVGLTVEELIRCDDARTVFPDIIVHRRGKDGPNLLVIEVKRRGAALDDVNLDKAKLHRYANSPLNYRHAFLVTIGDTRPECEVSDGPFVPNDSPQYTP